jgi:flagellar protein FlaF
LPARETEIAAFGSVNRMLESAGDASARIRAFGRNHDLWSTLVKDLARDGNKLPADLKAQLVSLGMWAMRYSTLAILHNLSADPLIEVNRNIAAGLALQATAKPSSEPLGRVETAL